MRLFRALPVLVFLLAALPPLLASAQTPAASAFHCSGSTTSDAVAGAASLGLIVDVQLDCGGPGDVTFTLPDGARVAARLTEQGRFDGTVGVAYVCDQTAAGIDTTVTVDGGGRWTATLAITAEAAPPCDYLLHAGVNRVTWSGESSSIAEALHTRRIGASPQLEAEARAMAIERIVVWQFDEDRSWPRGWGAGVPAGVAGLERFEPGETYYVISPAELPWTFPKPPPISYFEYAQIVSLYGHPNVPRMGQLGEYSPLRATIAVARLAKQYDRLNGDRDVIPALHLITGVAQSWPGRDGDYLGNLNHDLLAEYVEAARAAGQLLFLDVQIGWADPLTEVRKLEWALREPFVHLALDPEFATLNDNRRPGTVIGELGPADVNRVQAYLAELVLDGDLPPKILVIHQFLREMLISPMRYDSVPQVEITIDMDGFGGRAGKLSKYRLFAHSAYAERSALKIFPNRDINPLSPAEILALSPAPPDLVIYQ